MAIAVAQRERVAACGIAVMAKASTPGRAKTRLVPPLTAAEAAQFNTAFLRDVVENIGDAAAQISIACHVAFGPPRAKRFFRETLPGDVGLIPAWYPDFGDCLAGTIVQLLQAGHRAAVVLNSDSPTLPTSLLVETAQVLAQPGDRAVLGPADDGGYYLLGLKAAHRGLFRHIAWSTKDVARQTLERAAALGLSVHVLPQWYDVDDAAALKLLQAELFERAAFAPALRPRLPRHTRALMQSLLAQTDLQDRLNLGRTFGRAAE